jgi:hypothetical protein
MEQPSCPAVHRSMACLKHPAACLGHCSSNARHLCKFKTDQPGLRQVSAKLPATRDEPRTCISSRAGVRQRLRFPTGLNAADTWRCETAPEYERVSWTGGKLL